MMIPKFTQSTDEYKNETTQRAFNKTLSLLGFLDDAFEDYHKVHAFIKKHEIKTMRGELAIDTLLSHFEETLKRVKELEADLANQAP